MMKRYYGEKLRRLCLVLGVLFTVSTSLALGQRTVARISEGSLRKIAVKTVMPEYPPDSVRRQSKGVAVAELIFDEAGVVSQVEILEAPDSLIEKATTEAVRQWTFKPTRMRDEHGPPIRVQGKLTFYFVINDQGQARVENPKQFN